MLNKVGLIYAAVFVVNNTLDTKNIRDYFNSILSYLMTTDAN